MKVFLKVLILVFAVTLAIGGVMIYAKTKVEPPIVPHQTNQYLNDMSESYKMLNKRMNRNQEDSVWIVTLNRINIFLREDKITKNEADKGTDILLGKYASLFMDRSFALFKQSVWNENDHKYMLNVIAYLKQIKYTNGEGALKKGTRDSLAQIEDIISRYDHARAISRHTRFSGVTNAQNTISKARQFANDEWLANCSDLVRALNEVRPHLAESHYAYISSMVEKLTQYRSYTKDYYENTLVPQVDAAVTEYSNEAPALYGSKRDVNSLWNRAKGHYNEASEYYYRNN